MQMKKINLAVGLGLIVLSVSLSLFVASQNESEVLIPASFIALGICIGGIAIVVATVLEGIKP
jgi:hypothetical protein